MPEPGVWALMLLGFGAAGAGLRRNRAAAARA
ncbi:PEPxxWA-CTERM sorting domain-containing protein [Phenylobacterium sp.]|nr:PEPxxWA-CTERM sorting domain-containing protein [Phenylobacterium sp.]MBX3482768.1 PEPxxWA-CTERM sorting domain-containing protein [Phenylobacterium sp.]MCW5758901.1 PEPxxWA-CTERM sorting domain-containing protein [Phenylobacterium sp.]